MTNIVNDREREQVLAEVDETQRFIDACRKAEREENPSRAKTPEAIEKAIEEVQAYEEKWGCQVKAITPIITPREAALMDPSPMGQEEILRDNFMLRLVEKVGKVRSGEIRRAMQGSTPAQKSQARTILGAAGTVAQSARAVDKVSRWAKGEEVGSVSEDDMNFPAGDATPVGGAREVDEQLSAESNAGLESGCRWVSQKGSDSSDK